MTPDEVLFKALMAIGFLVFAGIGTILLVIFQGARVDLD